MKKKVIKKKAIKKKVLSLVSFMLIPVLFLSIGTTAVTVDKVLFPRSNKITSSKNKKDGLYIEWDKQENAEYYKIYRKEKNSWERIKTVSSKYTSYTDTTAKSGVTYTYKVKAYNKTRSAWSTGEPFTATRLDEPVLKSVTNTKSAVVLKWEKVQGATKYRVYKKIPGHKWAPLIDVGSNTVSYTDKDVTVGKSVRYTVKAFKGSVKSSFDPYGLKSIFLKSPKLSKLYNSKTGLKLTWAKVDGAKQYCIYRKSDSDYKKIAVVSSDKASYTDQKVKNNESYTYTVTAKNDSFESYLNTSGKTYTRVAAPTIKSAKSGNKTAIIKWEKEKNASSYIIFKKNSSGTYEKYDTVNGDKTSYTDKSVKAGKSYSYYIRYVTKAHISKSKITSANTGAIKIRVLDFSKPMVALTFDDGPYSPATNRILDVLEKYNGKATFFVVGDRVSTYSDCIKREFSLGCEIGNHTYSHTILTSAGASEIKSQLSKASKEVKKITGVAPTLMRPPGGAFNSTVKQNADYPMIIWSVDTLDWKTRSASSTVSAIKNNVKDGSIVLMHDLYVPTAEAVEEFVPWLVKKGYQLVTVSELMSARGVTMKNGEPYYNGYK